MSQLCCITLLIVIGLLDDEKLKKLFPYSFLIQVKFNTEVRMQISFKLLPRDLLWFILLQFLNKHLDTIRNVTKSGKAFSFSVKFGRLVGTSRERHLWGCRRRFCTSFLFFRDSFFANNWTNYQWTVQNYFKWPL